MFRVETVTDPDLVARVYRDLMEPTFIPDELITLESLQKSAAANGDVRIEVIREGDDPVAVAIAEWFPRIESILLAYLAVDARGRGKGYGSALMRQALDKWQSEFSPRLVVAEVEHPDWHEVDPARGDPTARVRFYGRLGARILDLPYFQAQLSPDTERVHGMLLMTLRIDPSLLNEAGDRVIDVAPLRELVQLDDTDLRDRATETTSEAVRDLIAALDDPAGVRLYDVEDYAQVRVSRRPDDA